MRYTKWLGVIAIWVGSWYLMYLEITSCRTVKAQLRPVVSSRLAEVGDAVAALNDLATSLRAH